MLNVGLSGVKPSKNPNLVVVPLLLNSKINLIDSGWITIRSALSPLKTHHILSSFIQNWYKIDLLNLTNLVTKPSLVIMLKQIYPRRPWGKRRWTTFPLKHLLLVTGCCWMLATGLYQPWIWSTVAIPLAFFLKFTKFSNWEGSFPLRTKR